MAARSDSTEPLTGGDVHLHVGAVHVPSLWYWGENDSARFPEAAIDLARQLNIESNVIGNANHAQAFRNSADVIEVVLPFLERLH